MKRFRWIKLTFLLLLVVGTVYILRRHNAPALHTAAGSTFGTEYHVSYVLPTACDSLIVGRLREVDRSLSMFNPQSTISRINAGRQGAVDPLLREVFLLSQQVSQVTAGAFDVTVAPLVDLWGFGRRGIGEVSGRSVDSLRTFVGFHHVALRGAELVKDDPRVQLDFSAVAKGYAVDRVAGLLDSLGAQHYMVEIGGEVRTRGEHPAGRPWRIGIARPTGNPAEGAMQTMLSLTDRAMATSGNYLRFYERGGRRYAHTIDPRTGVPVTHTLLSATVFAPTCAMADAYATAFMVVGLEGAKGLLKTHRELSAYLIYEAPDGRLATWVSPEIQSYVIQSES